MNYFRDVSALHDVLAALYKNAPSEARRATLSRFLEEWEFTSDRASLFASTVLCRNAEGSADWTAINAGHILRQLGPRRAGRQRRVVAQYNEGDLEVQCRPHLRAQNRAVRLKYNNGTVLPIVILTTHGKRSGWHLGTARLDTRSARFVRNVFRWLCTPDEMGMDRQ